ncbi:MAG: hypothetical protein ABWZ91_12440 [Nocardioides sp.]|jgi:hypothetical protein
MSAITAALPKYLQARTTAGILNIVRIVGTALFAVIAVILGIAGLIEWVDPHTNGLTAVLVIIGVGVAVVSGLLFYATVGWFVDTLNLLTQIAKNTAD